MFSTTPSAKSRETASVEIHFGRADQSRNKNQSSRHRVVAELHSGLRIARERMRKRGRSAMLSVKQRNQHLGVGSYRKSFVDVSSDK